MIPVIYITILIKHFCRRQGSGVGNPAGVAGAEETGAQMSQIMGQVVMSLGMLGKRQLTPRWTNDPVWLHNGVDGRVARGGCETPPQTENRRREEKGGEVNKSRVAYVKINNGA